MRTWWVRKIAIPTHPPDCEKGWAKRWGSFVKCMEGVYVEKLAPSGSRPRVKLGGGKGGIFPPLKAKPFSEKNNKKRRSSHD